MAKETSTEFPAAGRVSLWAYDSVNDKWYAVLADADGHLQIDVLGSALPTGASTAAKQDTMITSLQLIDDLRNALNSVGTDELDVVIDSQNVDVEVKQTTVADLLVGAHQYDGTTWRKSNLLWGYKDRYADYQVNTNAGAGTNDLDGDTVPSGEVWVVQNVAAINVNSACTQIRIQAYDGTYIHWVEVDNSPVANQPLIYHGELCLKEGDFIRARFTGCTAGDDIYLFVRGYKMKIDM